MTAPQRNPVTTTPDDDELLVERLEPPAGESDFDGNQQDLADRRSLRRVAGLSTELADITEVEYRQLLLGPRSPGQRLDQWQRGDRREFNRRAQGAGRDAGSQVVEGLIQRRDRPPGDLHRARKVAELRDVVVATGQIR